MISFILLISFIWQHFANLITAIVKKGVEFYLKYKEIINYLIVGGLTTMVSILSYALFKLVISNYIVCTILSWIVAVLFAYVTNRIFVFNSKDKKIVKEFIKFLSCRVLTLLIEVLAMFVLVDLLKLDDLISKIVVQFIIVILNYILSKIIVFKEENKKNK